MPRTSVVFSFVLAALFLFPAGVQAQVVYRLQPASKMWMEGTSNKSDWTVTATAMSGSVRMNQNVTPANPGVQAVEVTVPAAKIVSNKSTIMDRLLATALKVEEHPNVVYKLTSAKASAGSGNAFGLQTRGKLTLAGVTKDIDMAVQGQKLDNGQVRFTGSYALLMSDYGITPPSAMFGALHTGDRVVVHFDLVVAQDAGTR